MSGSPSDDAYPPAPEPRDLAASIRGKLKNQARAHGEDMLYLLSRYALERLLYRLGQSRYAEQFAIKGALLFTLWRDQPHRPTRDLDLLGFGSDDATRIQRIFADLCVLPVEEHDGLTFQSETLRVAPIREAQEYGGLRVELWCSLDQTRIRVRVDIGFGDAVTPAAEYADFPSLIGLPAPHVRVYPRETVVAEKYEALVRLGAINSRVKDFYDLWTLARGYSFAGPVFSDALKATFSRRATPLPAVTPIALTSAFAEDPGKRQLWQAFLTRSKLDAGALSLGGTVEALRAFLTPPTLSILSGQVFGERWEPGGPWTADNG